MNPLARIANIFRKKSTLTNPAAWFEVGFGANKSRSLEILYGGIIYSCIDAIASSVSTTERHLFIDDGDGSPDEVFDDAILEPIKRANRLQSGSDVLYLISSQIDIHGKSYVWPRKNMRGYPIELWVLDPTKVKKAISKTEFPHEIKGYVYQDGSVRVPFEVDEIIPIIRPNVFNQFEGISTIEKARKAAEMDLDAQDYNQNFFKKGARPDGILTTEEEINEDVFDRLKKQWQQYEGKDAKRTLVLEQGLKYQQLSLNQKDMDFIQSRKFSRDEILSIFKVPKSILGISDDVNRANAEAGEYIFAKYTILPRLSFIYEKFNQFYIPMFPNSERKFLKFDNPVPEDVEKLSTIRMNEVNVLRTLNEARAEANLPAVGAEGDKLYIPINLIEVGTEPDETEEDEDNKPKDKMPEDKILRGLKALTKIVGRERKFLVASRRYLATREKQMVPAMRQLYADLIREVRKEPISKANEGVEMILNLIMPKLDEFKSLAAGVVLRYNTDTFTQGLKNTEEYFELPVNFDLVNSGATAYLRSRANDTAESMRESMLNKARKVITDRMEEPEFTLAKAKKEVIKVFKEEADWRAQRIAQTEVQTAYNEANFRSYSGSGMVEKIKWIVSKSPCEICSQNEGVVVAIGDPFPSGHTHPIAHPNCECGHVPYWGV